MCCRPGGFAGGIDGLLYLGAGCRWHFQHRVGRGEPQLERYVGLEPGPGTDRVAAWRVADAAAPAAGYDAADLCRRLLDAVSVRARYLRIVRAGAVPRNGMGLAACLQYPEPDLFVCFLAAPLYGGIFILACVGTAFILYGIFRIVLAFVWRRINRELRRSGGDGFVDAEVVE